VIVVAYNAASTLAHVLDRVPKSFRHRIAQVFVCDDASPDSTYLVGLGYQRMSDDLPLTIIRRPRRLGYGGNQKAAYRLAIEQGLDIVVLLHADGQYAPEKLEDMVAPLERGECDAVFGSRMIVKGAARKGGMPLYKYVGNKVLTRFENRMLGTRLSELHSGYRAYSVKALQAIPFVDNSDGFDFDTEITIQLVDAGKRIVEIPIPTYYGDEIAYLDGMKYAKDVCVDVLRYRLNKMGFGSSGHAADEEYQVKQSLESSHSVILGWVGQMPPSRVLDLGCSSGLLAERMRAHGHRVTGVDVHTLPGVTERVDRFIEADLDRGLPVGIDDEGPFDVVVAADVLEHVREPERLLDEIRGLLVPHGVLIASVPNFGHWYSRGRTALGLFDYDQRGILDRGHVRFFTRRGFRARLRRAEFKIVRDQATGLPFEVLTRRDSPIKQTIRVAARLLVTVRPTLFGYQFVFQCEAPPLRKPESSPPGADIVGRPLAATPAALLER
jgi:SAM-dependent methyltransferase